MALISRRSSGNEINNRRGQILHFSSWQKLGRKYIGLTGCYGIEHLLIDKSAKFHSNGDIDYSFLLIGLQIGTL